VRVLLAGLLCAALAACGGSADAARAVVAQHLLAQQELFPAASEGAATAPRYLLVEQGAPSQAFVDRFAGAEPPLLAASDETHDLPANAARPGPAEAALTFWVADFDQTGESHGTARGGWYGPDGIRELYRFELRRDGGVWSVASATHEAAPPPAPVEGVLPAAER
jgi:hypothetical protein